MVLSVSCTCCALVRASAVCCGYLCYPSAVKRLWPLWSNPVPLSLIWCTWVVPLFLRCCVICHMVLIAQERGKVLQLPLRSYRQYNRISQFQLDNNGILLTDEQHRVLTSQSEGSTILYRPREDRQQVEGGDPRLDISDEERGALRAAHDALQFAAGIEGANANPGQTRITDLIRPKDPPILRAFAEELERWPEVDQFLEEAFWER